MSRQQGARRVMPTKKDVERLSHFRYVLRTFLRYSEEITQLAGITPLQYSLLVHVHGMSGRSWATVGELAERLQAASNGTGALVSRCERAQLVVRKFGDKDRRHVQVHLTRKGERCLYKLAALHLDQMRELERLLAET
jgi:DNA-binding MarR family transcriptional regulator